jgi:hemerythrin
MMCIELKFHFGIIKPTEELLDSRILAIIWIISHILTEDRKYGPYLNDKGVP